MPRSEIDLSEVYSVHHAYGRLSIAQDADHAVVHGTGDQLDTFIDKLNELTGRGDDVEDRLVEAAAIGERDGRRSALSELATTLREQARDWNRGAIGPMLASAGVDVDTAAVVAVFADWIEAQAEVRS